MRKAPDLQKALLPTTRGQAPDGQPAGANLLERPRDRDPIRLVFDAGLSLHTGVAQWQLVATDLAGVAQTAEVRDQVAHALDGLPPEPALVRAAPEAADGRMVQALLQNGFRVVGGEVRYVHEGSRPKPVSHPRLCFGPPTRADLPALAKLIARCPTEAPVPRPGDGPDPSVQVALDRLRHGLRQPEAQAMVAWDEADRPVGLLSWRRSGPEPTAGVILDRACIPPEQRDQGLFELLVRQTLATRLRDPALRVEVRLPAAESVALGEIRALRKLGFRFASTHLRATWLRLDRRGLRNHTRRDDRMRFPPAVGSSSLPGSRRREAHVLSFLTRAKKSTD